VDEVIQLRATMDAMAVHGNADDDAQFLADLDSFRLRDIDAITNQLAFFHRNWFLDACHITSP
jgi:hypothetical protein